MQQLIVQPLRESYISTVVIINALDECEDEEPFSAILSVLGRFVSKIPKVKFLVTSRPETHIWEVLHHPSLAEAVDAFALHEVERSQVINDIRLFFRHRFSEIVHRRGGLHGWPTEEQLDVLCARSAGSFVYAVAAAKFVDERAGDPRKRLNLLLEPPGTIVREDKTLDSFYLLILQGTFGGGHDRGNNPKILPVLGAIVLAADRLDERFHVSPSGHHTRLLVGCLGLMIGTLEGNMCELPNGAANSDIIHLQERIGRKIDPALRYACGSWHTHLVDRHTTSVDTPGIALAIHQFLEKKFLFWLEVLSVLGAVRNAIDALRAVADWLEVC